jgi:hypothetical protein
MLRAAPEKSHQGKYPALDKISSHNVSQWAAEIDMKLAPFGPSIVRPKQLPPSVFDQAFRYTLLAPGWCSDNIAKGASDFVISNGGTAAAAIKLA